MNGVLRHLRNVSLLFSFSIRNNSYSARITVVIGDYDTISIKDIADKKIEVIFYVVW